MKDEEIAEVAAKMGMEVTPQIKLFARLIAQAERIGCAEVAALDDVVGLAIAAAIMTRRHRA
jgi:antitoxin component of RelBE/YafQ-DinJ toxin-antitoxin module